MAKLVQCPLCGRMNSEQNVLCSNCGLKISAKKESKLFKGKIEEEILNSPTVVKIKEKFDWEILKPNETKLFLFVSLTFTSLFLHVLVKHKIIFSIIFYPTIYWFACYWATRQKINWQTFLIEFALLLFLFYLIFSFI